MYVDITMNANIDGIIVLMQTSMLFTVLAAACDGKIITSAAVMQIRTALAVDLIVSFFMYDRSFRTIIVRQEVPRYHLLRTCYIYINGTVIK